MIKIEVNTDPKKSRLLESWTVTVQQYDNGNIIFRSKSFDNYSDCAAYVEDVLLEYKEKVDRMRPKLTTAEINSKMEDVTKILDELWDKYHGDMMPEDSEEPFENWWESTFGVPVRKTSRK